MKKFKILLCAVLVLLSGAVFAACGDKNKDFDTAKISFDNEVITYDGNSHVFTVNYNGESDVNVTYSLEKDGNFVSGNSLGLKNAGEYLVYYKLSLKGYNDYVSNEPVEFTIEKRVLHDFDIQEKTILVTETNFTPTLVVEGLADNDDLNALNFTFKYRIKGDSNYVSFDALQLKKGDIIEVKLSVAGNDANKNYSFNIENVVFEIKVVGGVEVQSGGQSSWASSLEDAVNTAAAGSTIVLYSDVDLQNQLVIDKDLTIEGQNKIISTTKTRNDLNVRSLVVVSAGTVTIKDLEIQCKDQFRCLAVSGDNSEVTLENVKINGGSPNCLAGDNDNNKINGGLMVSGKAKLTMNGGSIKGNFNYFSNNVDEYGLNDNHQYAKDLWVGSQAQVTLKGAEVGFAWVNANSYADNSTDRVGLTISEGTTVGALFIEYDTTYATVKVESTPEKQSTVNQLFMLTADGETLYQLSNVTSGTFKSGVAVSATKEGTTNYYNTINEAFSTQPTEITLLCDVVLTEKLEVTSNLTINGEGHTITADFVAQAAADAMIFVPKATDTNYTDHKNALTITLSNVNLDGNEKVRCVYMGKGSLVLQNAEIKNGQAFNGNNEDSKINGGVYLTNGAHLELNNSKIKGNKNALDSNAEFGADDNNKYKRDLWVGANATANIVSGEVEYVWVNANRYSSQNAADFVQLTVNGGTVSNVFLELDQGGEKDYQGTIAFKGSATVANLVVKTGASTTETFENANKDTDYSFVAKAGTQYYYSLEDAIQAAKDELILLRDVQTSQTIEINKNLTIKSDGKIISAVVSNSFTNRDNNTGKDGILHIVNATVKLDNVVIDGSDAVRGIKVNDGNLTLMGGTCVKNCVGTTGAGAVYVTGNSTVNIENAIINQNNQAAVGSTTEGLSQSLLKWSADLWIGSQAKATISGGDIGSAWVNANQYLTQNSGLTITAGKIVNLYLEEQDGYGANATITAQTVENLYLAQAKGDDEEYITITNPSGSYKAGVVASTTNGETVEYYNDFENALNACAVNETLTLYANVTLAKSVYISKSITIDGQNQYKFIATTSFVGGTANLGSNNTVSNSMFILDKSAASVEFTLENVTLDGADYVRSIAAFAGKVNLTNATIQNGAHYCDRHGDSLSAGVFMSGKSELIATNTKFTNNNVYFDGQKQTGTMPYYAQYSSDLWVGSQAKATLNNGTSLTNVFVNANSMSTPEAGLTVDGAEVENVYLEFDDEHGGSCTFNSGDIDNLYYLDNGNAMPQSSCEQGEKYCPADND